MLICVYLYMGTSRC